MDISDGASHGCYDIFDATNEAPTARPPAPRFIWNFNTKLIIKAAEM